MTAPKCVHDLEPTACANVIDTFIEYNIIKNLETGIRLAQSDNRRYFDIGSYRWNTEFAALLLDMLKQEDLHVPTYHYPR